MKKTAAAVAAIAFVMPGLASAQSADLAHQPMPPGMHDKYEGQPSHGVSTHVLSVSLLASAFAGEDNNHKVENVTPGASHRPVDLDVGDLQMVAEFEQQVVGVAVSASGRVFVSFPRNGIDTVKNSVEEVIKNKAVAYPNEEINTLNTAPPSPHFLSAQTLYVDSSAPLWALDVVNPRSGTPPIPGSHQLPPT